MRHLRFLASLAFSAGLLAACGGGQPDVAGTGEPAGAPTTPGTFTAVVSFGDSLSDVGTYTPATSLTGNGAAPYFGGKFTTNTDPTSTAGTVWVENLAATLGLTTTAAEVGFAGSSVKCPAAANPAAAGTCTAYGQGGSRVTDPNGIGHTTATGALAALTVPMVTQMDNHLARFGSFKASDLILVYGGSNDVFAQLTIFAATATAIQTQAAAGQLTSDQANVALFQAQDIALGAMKQAAGELADAVKTKILAHGGTYVAVMTLSDIVDTPFGQALPASVQPVLTALSQNFNLWLRDGLAGQPVQIIDTYTIFKDSYANPAKYGIANNTTPACDADKINLITRGAVTDGSSLFCNSTPGAAYNGIRTGADANTWQFADSVHPTTIGHKLISDAFTAQLKAFGWL